MQPMNAVGILRQSQQSDADQSIPAQRRKVEQAAASLGFNIVDWIEERSVSGATPIAKRPVARGIEAIKDGRAHALMFADQTRTNRDFDEHRAFVMLVQSYGGKVFAGTTEVKVMHQDADDIDGGFTSDLLAMVSARERLVTRRKTIEGRHGAFNDGKFVQAVPFGYVCSNGQLSTVEPAATTMRETFIKAATLGLPEAATYFSARVGYTVVPSNVAKRLRNRVYRGEAWIDPAHPRRNNHEALVTEAVFQKANTADRRTRRSMTSEAYFSGVLRCGLCGGPMTGMRDTRTDKLRYICSAYVHQSVGGCPNNRRINADMVEEVVRETFVHAARQRQARDDRPDTGRLEDALATAELARDEFAADLSIPPAIFKARAQAYEDAVTAAQQQLDAARAAIPVQERLAAEVIAAMPVEELARYAAMHTDSVAVFPPAPEDDKGRWTKPEVHRDRIVIQWHVDTWRAVPDPLVGVAIEADPDAVADRLA